MKVMPAMVMVEPIAGVVIVEAPKVAVSPAASGIFAGVQFAALFQLLFAGTAFHVCAELVFEERTMPHKTAIEEASKRTGFTPVEGLAIFWAVVVERVGRFMVEMFSGCKVKREWVIALRVIFPTWPVASLGFTQSQIIYRVPPPARAPAARFPSRLAAPAAGGKREGSAIIPTS